MHLVVKGSFAASVSTAESRTVIVAVFRRQDLFGELAVLGAEPERTATVAALEPSETLCVTTRDFAAWRARGPHIDRLIIQALTFRLREMTDQMLDSLFAPVEVRVARRLLLLHLALAPQSIDGWIRIRQEELAEYCGLTRPTVNRVLSQLVRERLLELGRARLRVADVARLERLADSHQHEAPGALQSVRRNRSTSCDAAAGEGDAR